jgi:hypothetical protein
MKIENKIKFGMFFLVVILMMSFTLAYTRSSPSYTPYSQDNSFGGSYFRTDRSMCEAGQDFVIQIAPFGCSPSVVRSDLLEEQNVPVFCQLAATKINPLIDVEAIESMSFSGKYPDEVAGVGFHPAKAALGGFDMGITGGYGSGYSRDQSTGSIYDSGLNSRGGTTGVYGSNLNSPMLNNIGYAVIVLKKQKNESAMPEYIQGNLSARIRYDIVNAYGIGKASFYLPELNEEDWQDKFSQYGFWNSRGYLRAEQVDDEGATIEIYADDSHGTSRSGFQKRKISSVQLREGETSRVIYLPGFDCLAGMNIRLDGLENPDTKAKLEINGEIVEVKERERFLENKCYVSDLGDKKGLVQEVDIRCDTDSGNKNLNLKISPKIQLSFEGSNNQGYELGDFLYTFEKESVYLGYIGSNKNTGRTEDLFVYLVAIPEQKSKLSENELNVISRIARSYELSSNTGNTITHFLSNLGNTIYGGLTELSKAFTDKQNNIKIEYGTPLDFNGKEVKIDQFVGGNNLGVSNEYFNWAMDDYETILDSFSSVESTDEKTFGEKALIEKIKLSNDMGEKKTSNELCEEFKQKYPSSKENLLSFCDSDYENSNSEASSKSILINNRVRTISFKGISEPSKEEYSAEIKITGPNGKTIIHSFGKDEILSLKDLKNSGENTNEFIQLLSIRDNYANVNVNIQPTGLSDAISRTITSSNGKLTEGIPNNLRSDYVFELIDVKLKKLAKVSVIPSIDNSETKVNFTFSIGIEKREEDLLPDKIDEKIEEINDTINDWEEKSEDLGDVVKGMKKACLGVGAALTVKNFFVNTGGKGIARQQVMRNSGGINDLCSDAIGGKGIFGSKGYQTVDECYSKESDYINKAVDARYEIIKAENEKYKKLQDDKSITTTTFLGDRYVNDEELAKNLFTEEEINKLQNSLETCYDGEVNVGNKNVNVNKIINSNTINFDKMTVTEFRDLSIEAEFCNKGYEKIAKTTLNQDLSDIYVNSEEDIKAKSYVDDLDKKEGLNNVGMTIARDKDYQTKEYDGGTNTGFIKSIGNGLPVQAYGEGNEKYLLHLEASGNKKNEYLVKGVYDYENGNIVDNSDELTRKINLNLNYIKYDESFYENPIHSSSQEVKYYETEPYKGYPAIVPFDVKNGWYAATKQTLPIGGGIKSFESSGRVVSFYLCNVGTNHRIEFKSGYGDDKCEMINLGTGQAYNQFSGLSKSQMSTLVDKAVKAIEDASRQYQSGVKNVRINGEKLSVGSPQADIPDMQCQDFMSPSDCKILFNVCDPVICPSSRCDLGGAYPVKDVIQSGIIGSIALCLPNFKEGIIIPICLSGIKAGMDAYLSVIKSYRDCLQEAMDTGEMIGICDEIYSIHLCEFFWKQGLPLIKIAIPKVMEIILGQNVHGGGEYLGVASAWETAENSVGYFTQYYAANSYKAFKARTAEDVGDEVCNNFASASYPDGGNILDALTEPDSPPQFHGRFDEIPFTDATNPPVSHYKVFYHIFAGKDSRVYYSIYLKDATGSSYYQDTSQRRVVDSGYIGKGEYVSETKDFTAPSGYKQMCMNVNGQEECGFKEVSTSFAINYVKDKYVESEANNKDIKTETECIAGGVNGYSLLSPNLQGGAEEFINPKIYNRGLIRICATDSPGSGTDGRDGVDGTRWIEVGYCGDKKMRCWLDTDSIENSINGVGIKEDLLNEMNQHAQEVLENKGNYLNDGEINSKIKEIKNTNDDKTKIELINGIINRVFFNNHKAQLYLLRGGAYGELAKVSNVMEESDGDGDGNEIIDKDGEFVKTEIDSETGEMEYVYTNDKFCYGDHSCQLNYEEFPICEENKCVKKIQKDCEKSCEDDYDCEDNEECYNGCCRKIEDIEIIQEAKQQTVLELRNIAYVKEACGQDFLITSLESGNLEINYSKITSVEINPQTLPTRKTSFLEDFLKNLKDEDGCAACGDGGGSCYLCECALIGFKLNKNCVFVDKSIFPGGTCIEDENFKANWFEDLTKDPKKEIKIFLQGNDKPYDPKNYQENIIFISLPQSGVSQHTSPTGNAAKNYDKEFPLYILKTKIPEIFDLKSNKKYFDEIQNKLGIVEEEETSWWDSIRDAYYDFFEEDNSVTIANIFVRNEVVSLRPKKRLEDTLTEMLENLEINEQMIINAMKKFKGIEIEEEIEEELENDFIQIILSSTTTTIFNGNVNKRCDVSFGNHEYARIIEKYSTEYNVDPVLVLALILEESSCKVNLISKSGAQGLMQIVKGTFEDHCNTSNSNLGINSFEDIKGERNVENNIHCGIKILSDKYKQFKNGVYESWSYKNSDKFIGLVDNCVSRYSKYSSYRNWEAALRGYNGWGCNPENSNVNYVEEIVTLYEGLKKI